MPCPGLNKPRRYLYFATFERLHFMPLFNSSTVSGSSDPVVTSNIADFKLTENMN